MILFLSTAKSYCQNQVDFNRDVKNYNKNLYIYDKNQLIAKFKIMIADTDEKRQYGLMNVEKLDQNHGMLFIFNKPQIVNMWMKNTLIPLDMIFIKNGKIVNIKTNAKPHDLSHINSEYRVDRILEINAGLVKKFKIKIGQNINYADF